MFYYFQSNGDLVALPMASSHLCRHTNGTTITAIGGHSRPVDAGTLEILTAEEVRAHLLDVSGPPTYDAAFAESATEFFAGVVGMTVIAAANEKYPNSLKARMAYILATLP